VPKGCRTTRTSYCQSIYGTTLLLGIVACLSVLYLGWRISQPASEYAEYTYLGALALPLLFALGMFRRSLWCEESWQCPYVWRWITLAVCLAIIIGSYNVTRLVERRWIDRGKIDNRGAR
jgi:hypothetical protein